MIGHRGHKKELSVLLMSDDEDEEIDGSSYELPPHRGHEHAILLKQGSNPVRVHPYRYSQSQKDEIRKDH